MLSTSGSKIPEPTASKVLKKLARAGVVTSQRGAKGGYSLARAPERIGIHEVIEAAAADFDINLGKLGQPIRVAVTSGPVSPPIDVTLWLVGQERTVRRLDHAIQLIEARAAASGG